MVKNENYVGVVSRLGSNGEGIVREKDCTVFVPYALPQEKIKYRRRFCGAERTDCSSKEQG